MLRENCSLIAFSFPHCSRGEHLDGTRNTQNKEIVCDSKIKQKDERERERDETAECDVSA